MNNSTHNVSVPAAISWIIKSVFYGFFHQYSYIKSFNSEFRFRISVNILFLATEIGGLLGNLYFMIRIFMLMKCMKTIKSHYRAIVFYNQYTYISIGLCLHLSIAGCISCFLILSIHIYFIYYVTKSEEVKEQTADTLLSCSYIPFLRDALFNVYVYILLTILVLYRRADIKSISQRLKTYQRKDLTEQRRTARVVLLHSLPWVLSLGLALPRGLLDMKYDFRITNLYKNLETPLSEELCLHQSKDIEIVGICMWSLQAWMPVVLSLCLCITYSVRDKKTTSNGRGPNNRRHSVTTLGGKAVDSNMYSSSRTLYSLHNYKDEVVKLVKSSPRLFYFILIMTIFLRFPFNIVFFVDNCAYLIYSDFICNQLLIIVLKDLEYLHLAILPLVLLKAIVMLVNNSMKISEIRKKVKQLADNDDLFKNSVHNNKSENNNNSDNDDNDFTDSEKPFMLSTV